MKSCVSDDTLLLCYLDEAPASVRSHVATCASCASRYQQLNQTLAHAEQELQTGCPPHRPSQRTSFSHWWFPAAAAIAAVVVIFWSVAVRPPPEPLVHTGVHDPEVRRFLAREVSPALSVTNGLSVTPIPAPVSSAGYVYAALAGGWPCEQTNSLVPLQCEVAPFFFFFAD